MKQKRNILVTGLAVTLAAATLVGGATYAYLRSETEDVVNTFNANQVTVSLAETTGASYDIIPGTVQQKDPTVTVNNTVDSYAYAVVTDMTDGLVSYEIADGWQLLEGWNGEHTKVYYRAVAKEDETKTFSVLKNNQVSYDAALENSDMLQDGALKTGINLTFSAYAVQQAGFDSAKAAFESGFAAVNTSEGLNAALSEGKTAVLTNTVTMPEALEAAGEVTILGNGNDLISPTGNSARIVNINNQEQPVVLNIKDANLVGPVSGTYTRGISVYNSADVTMNIEDSSVSANYYAINIASANQRVELNFKNTALTGWTAFQTHSPYVKATFENCTLIGNNTFGKSEWNSFGTVVINRYEDGNPDPDGAHDCDLTFKNCRIEANQTTGNKQYFIDIRAKNTTLTVENCTFFKDGTQLTLEEAMQNVKVNADVYDTLTLNIQ